MIYATVIFFVVFVGKMIFDLHLFYSGRSNHHTLGPAIVLLALVVCSVIGYPEAIPMWWFGWWALNDTIFGAIIGHRFPFVGTTAFLDIQQRKYPWLVWFKYIGFLLSIIFFIWKQQ